MKDFEDMLKQHLDNLKQAHYCHEIGYDEYRELCKQAIASCEREMQNRYGDGAQTVIEMILDDYDIF